MRHLQIRLEAVERLRRAAPLAPAVVALQSQQPPGGPVDAVRQLSKTQHGHRMRNAKQLQEGPRVADLSGAENCRSPGNTQPA